MIVKIVQKDRDAEEGGGYYHEMLAEADRIEVQFLPQGGEDAELGVDWGYNDQLTEDRSAPAVLVRMWRAWPQTSYEIGVVRSGRIFLMNDRGNTIDRYVV